MKLGTMVTKKLVEKILLRSMTGRLTDMEKVLSLAHRMGDTGLHDFLVALARDSLLKAALPSSFSDLARRQIVGGARGTSTR